MYLHGDLINTYPVTNSLHKNDAVEVVTATPLEVIVDNFYNIDDMKKSINISGDIYAPIYEGQKLGEATYTIYGEQYVIDLVAKNEVERKPDFNLLQFVSNILIILLRLLLVFALIVLIFRIINHFRKKKRRRSRRRMVHRYNARFHK